ncbi:MAG: GDYXXLXY domain-containing protein [Phycicoccus sp.]
MTRARMTRLAAVVLAQLLLVVAAVWAPLAARLTGEEVVLRVAPVDPIDPFRGAYVELSYPDLPDQPGLVPADGSPPEPEPVEPEVDPDERGTAYVPLRRDGEIWVGGPLRRTRPAEGPYLACDDSESRLRCGIESWFLPQDDARALEDAVAGGTVRATVRVDGRGHAALVAVRTG